MCGGTLQELSCRVKNVSQQSQEFFRYQYQSITKQLLEFQYQVQYYVVRPYVIQVYEAGTKRDLCTTPQASQFRSPGTMLS